MRFTYGFWGVWEKNQFPWLCSLLSLFHEKKWLLCGDKNCENGQNEKTWIEIGEDELIAGLRWKINTSATYKSYNNYLACKSTYSMGPTHFQDWNVNASSCMFMLLLLRLTLEYIVVLVAAVHLYHIWEMRVPIWCASPAWTTYGVPLDLPWTQDDTQIGGGLDILIWNTKTVGTIKWQGKSKKSHAV